MKKTQQFVFYLGCFAMVTFFTSVMAYMYANFQKGVATMVTVMLILTVFSIGGQYIVRSSAFHTPSPSPICSSTVLGLRAMQRIRYKGKKYLGRRALPVELLFV